MSKNMKNKKGGFSLMELLAVVTILGIIAAIIVPRVSVSRETATERVHAHNIATINSAVERFFVETGNWPPNDLSNFGTAGMLGVDAPNYFPDGLPDNPINPANAYAIDGTTRRVIDTE